MLTRTLPLAVVAGVVIGLVPTVAEAPGTAPMRAAHGNAGEPGTHEHTGTPSRPLAGVRIALDPGHQLGNHNFPTETTRTVSAGAGGYRKACNTAGAQIDGGLAEATVTWLIARDVRRRLRGLGAEVVMSRHDNSEREWGPCVSRRGRFGAREHARLTVSIHADGATSTAARGFHVIAPAPDRMVRPAQSGPSARLARALRRGLDGMQVPRADYVGGGTGLVTRDDLATLNLSRIPVAMVEVGNVHNPADARLMSTRGGRDRYAAALVAGIRGFLRR